LARRTRFRVQGGGDGEFACSTLPASREKSVDKVGGGVYNVSRRWIMDDIAVAKREGVNWKQVGLFLILTFGLT
jgi:hypothetical protein